MAKKLFRSLQNKKIGGIRGGLGKYFDIEPMIVRLLWVAIAPAFGSGIIAYILRWIIVPKEPIVRVINETNYA
jgi:phage shock protein C